MTGADVFKFVVFGYHAVTTDCCNYLAKAGSPVLHCYPVSRQIPKINHASLTYFSFSSINSQRLFEAVRHFEADFIISIICGEKIPSSVVNLSKYFGLNIHPARLPQCRTANAWFWPIRLGHSQSAITVHLLEDDYDAGDIVYEQKFPIDLLDNQESYSKKVVREINVAIDRLYKMIAAGQIHPRPQSGQAKYYGKVTFRDICIDWKASTRSVYNLIRACNPCYPAVTNYRHHVLAVYEARLTPLPPSRPGELSIFDDRLFCSCADGVLELTVFRLNGIVSAGSIIELLGLRSKSQFSNSAEADAFKNRLGDVI